MYIKVNEFNSLEKVVMLNKEKFDKDIIEKINEISESLQKEEITILLKKDTVEKYLDQTFSDAKYNQSLVRYLSNKLDSVGDNTDIPVSLTRKGLAEMYETFKNNKIPNLSRIAGEISLDLINKLDDVDMPKSLIKNIADTDVENISFEDSIVKEKYHFLMNKKDNRPKF